MARRTAGFSGARAAGERAGLELGGCPMFLALRQGWEVRRLGLDTDLVYLCLEGAFEIRGRKGARPVRSGEVVVVPAGLAFHFALGDRPVARIARFRLRWSPRRQAAPRGLTIYRFGRTTGNWLTVLRAEAAGDKPDRRGVSLALSGLMASLETSARRQGMRHGRLRELSMAEKERIRTWAEDLAPRSRPGLPALAGLLAMSPDYCARLFRQSFGVSFEKWIIAARMHSAAIRLTESGLSIGAIADEFGFSTPFFFSRQFKEVMGCSPRRYRTDPARQPSGRD